MKQETVNWDGVAEGYDREIADRLLEGIQGIVQGLLEQVDQRRFYTLIAVLPPQQHKFLMAGRKDGDQLVLPDGTLVEPLLSAVASTPLQVFAIEGIS